MLAFDFHDYTVIIKHLLPYSNLTFVFTSWPTFFINVYSCHTCCPRLEATTVAKGSGSDEWESFIAPSGLPHFLPPPPLTYSPLLTTSSSLSSLPTLRPPYHETVYLCLADITCLNWAHSHIHTCLFPLFLGSKHIINAQCVLL